MERRKRTGNRILIAAVCVLLFCGVQTSFSSERIVSLDAAVDRSKVGIDDTVILTVTAHTENVKALPSPRLPDLPEFSVVNEQTGSSLSITIVNGKKTQKREQRYIYTLKPLKEGTFVIDAVSIQYKGVTYSTSPLTVTVVEGYSQDAAKEYMLDDGTPIDIGKLRRDIFIRVKPAETSVVVGQQVVLSYKLYSRIDIDSISLKSAPEFAGFYKEDIYNATKLENRREVIEEEVYETTLLKKVALYPIKPGTFSLNPLVLETTVIVKSEDPFGIFGRPFTFQLRSNDVEIEVKPLPPGGPSAGFSHIVGDLTLEITGRERTVAAGESTACYVVMKSTGNLGSINPPQLLLSKRGRVYLSDTKADRVEEKDGLYLTRRYEYTIIPEESGTLKVDVENIVFYHPDSGQYIVADPDPFTISVTGKSIAEETLITGSGIKARRGNFSFIKKDVKRLTGMETSLFGSRYYYLYHAVLILWTGIFFLIKSKRESLKQNRTLFRQVKAYKTAKAILDGAKSHLERGELQDSVKEINLALFTYIAHKDGTSPQDVTAKNILPVSERLFQLDERQKEDLRDVVDSCTAFMFSKRKSKEGSQVSKLLELTVRLIDSLERR
ncbi:MAG: protein BatD [Spirochaetes bacterium]|nr:protein BatD [Spirochaetota bacterium]